MLSNAESSQDKIWPLKFLIHFGNELPDGIRQELFSMLSCFVKNFGLSLFGVGEWVGGVVLVG